MDSIMNRGLLIALLFSLLPAFAPAQSNAIPAAAQLCLVCHGDKAQGNKALQSPPLAGLPAWYIRDQIDSYRQGHRGGSTNTPHATIMRGIALNLDTNTLPAAIDWLEKQKPVPPPVPKRGDKQLGQEIYFERCMGCHFYHGWGDVSFKSAPLAIFPDWYQHKQMRHYKQKLRGQKPAHEPGWKMGLASNTVTEEEMRHIWAFLAELGKKPKPKR